MHAGLRRGDAEKGGPCIRLARAGLHPAFPGGLVDWFSLYELGVGCEWVGWAGFVECFLWVPDKRWCAFRDDHEEKVPGYEGEGFGATTKGAVCGVVFDRA